MELIKYLGFETIGAFVWGMVSNILAARADLGLKRLEDILAAKFNDGQLPANHDLRQAVTDALRQALHSLALALASSQQPGLPFLAELRRQLKHPEARTPTVLTALLHVPLWTDVDSAERAWINALAKLIDDDPALARLAARNLQAANVDALLDETPPAGRGDQLQQAVAQWIAVELAAQPGRPPLLDEYLREGWPLDADGQRISLYTAWCWFFRETVKDRPKVFNIYVAETLAELKQQLNLVHPELSPALARLPAPALDDFRASLAAGFAELKTYLDARFDDMGQRLDAIRETQAAHTGLLHDLRDRIGGFPGLWQSNRRWRYGLIGFAALVLGGGVYLIYQTQQNPQQTATAVQQTQNRDALAAYFRSDIQKTFEQKKADASKDGKNWEVIRDLERWREMELGRVNELVEDLDGLTGETVREAKEILSQKGTDDALAYLESHESESGARIEQHRVAVDAAEEKLRQDVDALFFKADLHQTRYQWDQALASLRKAAKAMSKWWKTRWRLGNLLTDSAHYAEAQPELQAAVALAEKDKDKANAMNSLAILYWQQGHWAEAEPLFRQALAINEKNYGPEHPDVASSLINLAQLLKDTNRPAVAEPLMRRALAIKERSYGPEHSSVATALGNLALLLKDTNRLAEAEPLMRRVVRIFEKSYGPEHPNVAIALNNLEQLLKATNRLAEAEPLMRRVVRIFEKSYGPEHPNVAIALNNLAMLMYDTNRLAEVEPLMRRVLAIDEKSLGAEHPMVAANINNLAQLLKATGRLTEAEPLIRRVVEIFEKSYGPDHPNVATALNNLARLLQTTNRLAEAEPLMRRAVVIRLKSTRAAGHELPYLRDDFGNYQTLLTAQKLKPPAIAQRLDSLGLDAGYTAEEWAAVRAGWQQVRVAGVVPGSQAEALGLQPGDVITHYAGEKFTLNTRLIEMTSLTKTPAIPLTILRAGKEITLTAQPGKLGVRLE